MRPDPGWLYKPRVIYLNLLLASNVLCYTIFCAYSLSDKPCRRGEYGNFGSGLDSRQGLVTLVIVMTIDYLQGVENSEFIMISINFSVKLFFTPTSSLLVFSRDTICMLRCFESFDRTKKFFGWNVSKEVALSAVELIFNYSNARTSFSKTTFSKTGNGTAANYQRPF